jgi:hypothetical protein
MLACHLALLIRKFEKREQIASASLKEVCEKWTLTIAFASAVPFPARDKKFPVPDVGNSSNEASCLNGFRAAGEGIRTEIPCIFPVIREFGLRDAFARASQHSHLVAIFWDSLLTFTEPCRRSPKLRHQLAFIRPDTREGVSREERLVSPGLSLLGSFGGHTCR